MLYDARMFVALAALVLTGGCRRPPANIADQKAALLGTWHSGGSPNVKLMFQQDGTFECTFDMSTAPGHSSTEPDVTTGMAGRFAEKQENIVVTIERNVFRSPDAATEQKWKSVIEGQEQTHLSGVVVFETPTRLHIVWSAPNNERLKGSSASFDKD